MELMRFSEAMRLGAMLAPQTFHMERSAEGGTCAGTAAADATGLGEQTYQIWPWIAGFDTPAFFCPVCMLMHRHVLSIVIHLNDEHRWTREQIADHVEWIERARGLWPEPATAPEPVCVG